MINIEKFKKPIIIVVGFVLLVVLIVIVKEQLGRTAPGGTLQKQKIPQLIAGKYEASLVLEEKDFGVPGAVPVLIAERSAIGEGEIREIANRLGFKYEPTIAEDVFEGTTYIFTSDENSLVSSLKTGKLDYTLNLFPETPNKQLSDDSIKNLARNFLVDNGFSTSDIEFSSIVFLKEKGGEGYYPVDKKAATFYQVNFSPKVSGFPVLTLDPQKSPIYAQVLPDGTVFAASATRFAGVKKSDNQYKTKDFETVKSEMGESTVVSIDYGNINLADLNEKDIEEIRVNKIGLAYFYEGTSSSPLQPVFLMEGKVTIKGYGKDLLAILYLPAIDLTP